MRRSTFRCDTPSDTRKERLSGHLLHTRSDLIRLSHALHSTSPISLDDTPIDSLELDIRSICKERLLPVATSSEFSQNTRGHLRKDNPMTSVSQQSQIPASNSTSASQSTLSYASTAKKAVSSPVNATSSSTPSPAVAVGGAGPVQHGKSSSISPMNGKPAVSPAVPVVSAPAIAHSSSATNGSDHSRKSSVTIGANGMNGGPVGGLKTHIQFGSVPEASPKASHSTTEAQHTSSAPIAIPNNPRVTDPSHSPSPIPAPSASGGKPPSGLGQGNNPPMAFGSFDNVSCFFFSFAQAMLTFATTATTTPTQPQFPRTLHTRCAKRYSHSCRLDAVDAK